MQYDVTMALIGGGLLVATIGFLDDHGHVPASLRLIFHLLAFSWAVWWLGGLPPVDFGWGAASLGPFGTALMIVYLAWFLNLFNFMDGIDGIAGAQALSMTATASLLLWMGSDGAIAALPMLLLAGATAGFLVWNWPPARIFMGDAGSGYLGFALGAMALWTAVEGWLTVWVWLILGGAFLADATVTLLVRARAGLALATAHRSHAYQRLSRYWGSHRSVTLAFTCRECPVARPVGVACRSSSRSRGCMCCRSARTAVPSRGTSRCRPARRNRDYGLEQRELVWQGDFVVCGFGPSFHAVSQQLSIGHQVVDANELGDASTWHRGRPRIDLEKGIRSTYEWFVANEAEARR